MKSRLPLALSLIANVALALAVFLVWRQRMQPTLGTGEMAPVAARPATAPQPAEPPPAIPAPIPTARFTWTQIESEDYRQYIANLRDLGCPERLIRDLIVLDLTELYNARRSAVKAQRLPPWAGGDRREQAAREYRRQIEALDEEQTAVTEELLGFPWNTEGIDAPHEDMASILFGHLDGDQISRIVSLTEIYRNRAQRLRERVGSILLPEDRAALEAMAVEFESRAAGITTPALWEETLLRVQAVLTLGSDLHIEAADLTGAQVREVARLASRTRDLVREGVFDLEPAGGRDSEAREAELKAAVLQTLGPAKAADIERAKDDRFREVLDFAQARQLPRQTAIKAFDIRAAAEAEAGRVREDRQIDETARRDQLESIRLTTTLALTRVLGQPHAASYFEASGQWIHGLAGSVGDLERGDHQ